MMIVDLIDEMDFKEKLIAIGVPVTTEKSLDGVRETLLSWLQDCPEQRPFVDALFVEMQDTNVLPEVSAVIEAVCTCGVT